MAGAQERGLDDAVEGRGLSVARFVGSDNADDVVFVRNMTEAANLLAVPCPRYLCALLAVRGARGPSDPGASTVSRTCRSRPRLRLLA